MEIIIPQPDKSLLLKELTPERFVRHTNFGKNEIYIFNSNNSPNLMQEVGRLRELSFRMAGGGTGKSVDIDQYDLGSKPFEQLIVWNPVNQEIVGGYRFVLMKKLGVDSSGKVKTPTSKLFYFSQ